jgi:hypothetical protein
MEDYLGNKVTVGDTVLLARREGRTANLSRGFVKDMKMGRIFRDGALTNMVLVEWSNLHMYWLPAKRVAMIPAELLPEKRREKKLDAEEAVVVSEL